MALTYPVDTNERYCVWDATSGIPYKGKENITWPADGGAGPLVLSPNLVMLLRVVSAQPAYDLATQKLEQTKSADVVAETYTIGWNVVAKTQEEQDAYARQLDIQNRETQAKTLYAALDAGTATAAQAQKVLAWLLKREFNDL